MNAQIRHTKIHEKLLKTQDTKEFSSKSMPAIRKLSDFKVFPNGRSVACK